MSQRCSTVVLLLCLVGFAWCQQIPVGHEWVSEIFSQEGALDGSTFPHPRYAFGWKHVDDNTVRITVSCRTSGWVAHGISPVGGMKEADIVLLTPNSDGSFTFQDMHSKDYITPVVDEEQNHLLISATYDEDQGATTFTYERNVDVCDKEGDYHIDRWNAARVIYAFGESGSFSKHEPQNKGTASAWFFGEDDPPVILSGNFLTKNLTTTPDYPIPPLETKYTCFVHEMPSDKRYHILQYEYHPDPANIPYIHHIVLYGCSDVEVAQQGYVDGEQRDCSSYMCSTAVDLWSQGVHTTSSYPDGFAMPFGPNEYGEITSNFIILEVHYTNPDEVPGLIDNTYVELTYTDDIEAREELGIFVTGLVPDDDGANAPVIPPGEEHVRLVAQCPNECVKPFVPPTGITILQGALHMHQLGTSMTLHHIQNGVEIEPILQISKGFDYNHQYWSKPIGGDRHVGKRDRFALTCNYDSRPTSQPTIQGFGTYDEMCVAFFAYYPRMSGIEGCLDVSVKNELNLTDVYVCFEGTLADEPVLQPGLVTVSSDRLEYQKYVEELPASCALTNSTATSLPRWF